MTKVYLQADYDDFVELFGPAKAGPAYTTVARAIVNNILSDGDPWRERLSFAFRSARYDAQVDAIVETTEEGILSLLFRGSSLTLQAYEDPATKEVFVAVHDLD